MSAIAFAVVGEEQTVVKGDHPGIRIIDESGTNGLITGIIATPQDQDLCMRLDNQMMVKQFREFIVNRKRSSVNIAPTLVPGFTVSTFRCCTGEHDKIQDGYGKYQGTCPVLEGERILAKQYDVEPFLRALFEYDVLKGEVDTWPVDNSTPVRKRPKIHSPAQRYDRDFTPEQEHGHNLLHQQYRHQQFRQNGSGSSLVPPPPLPQPQPEEPPLEGAERYRSILMAIFLNDDTEEIPHLLTDPTIPEDLDIDLVIDDQGHTALHWAAALAWIQGLELLVQKHADVRRVNNNGESALIRAVLVTNNYDKQSFPHLLSILHRVITPVDHKKRTLLHHIAMMAGVQGREGAASR
ncbi:hypothetical protein KI688_011344 [Linnemannia hyalina]|uniref:Ankyrin n=1 Tax=Linnemannia hyalina TaxID=64524 RepID=A0A9P7XV85_9FUNG|nr:hypothetical protein KI688_011344 [Linnemannia hyalina]